MRGCRARTEETGILIDRQPYFYGFGNFGLFGPYSLLMSFYYGAGLDLFNLNTDGYMNDASILAARFDYAVASNLNIFTTFFWADRASANGYGWGFMRPQAPDANGGGSAVEFSHLSTLNAYTVNAPSIPDNNLGWEINAGVDWKLLEHCMVRVLCRILAAWAMVQLRLCRQDGSKLEHTNYLPVQS